MTNLNDNEELQKLIKISVDPTFVIKLGNPFSTVSVQPFWVMLKSNNQVVEGKLFLQNNLSKLVIFEPGFPGGGSTQFEHLWLEKILQNGYSVFLARHGGTIINGKYSESYINCKKRQNLSKSKGLSVLGNKENNTIADWLAEPLVALETLVPHFSEVVLSGHSFGPLALIDSLQKYVKSEPELSKKISRIVSLSGSIGIIRNYDNSILKIWFEHLDTDYARERVQVGDAKANTDIFGDAHTRINNEASNIPDNIDFIAVTPYGNSENTTDEIVQPMESIDFINSLSRGYFIVDKKEFGDKKSGRMAHDMEALSADMLLKLVSNDWLPQNQITTIE